MGVFLGVDTLDPYSYYTNWKITEINLAFVVVALLETGRDKRLGKNEALHVRSRFFALPRNRQDDSCSFFLVENATAFQSGCPCMPT